MFLRILLASATRRRERKALAAAAIWIGVTLVVSLLALGMDAGEKMNRELRRSGANIRIEPATATLPVTLGGIRVYEPPAAYLDETALPNLKKTFWKNNVLGIVPRLASRARIGGREADLLGVWFERDLAVEGETFPTGARSVYGYWRVEGEWPREGETACLVGRDLAGELGLAPGGEVAVAGLGGPPGPGGAVTTFRVAGILAAGPPEDEAVVVSLASAQALSGAAGKISVVDVSALTTPENTLASKERLDPASLTPAEYERWACTPYPGSVARDLEKALPGSTARVVRRAAEREGAVMTRIGGLAWTLAAFAFAVTCLGVMGVIHATVIERRQEVALVRAIGALRGDVLAQFCVEGAAGGLLAGTLGGATGLALGSFLVRAVFGGEAEVHPVLFFLGPVLGLAVAWTGGVWPVRQVFAQETAQVLHGN